MSSNPINPRSTPSGPDRSKANPSDAEIRKKWQQIQEVEETDPNKKGKNRNKQLERQMGENADEFVDLSITLTPPSAPFASSPTSASSGIEGIQRTSSASVKSAQTPEGAPVPSPAYSPPPTVESPAPSPSPSPKASTSPSPLPTSGQFWNTADVSTNEPPASGANSGGYTYTPAPPVPRNTPAPVPSGGESTENEEENEAPVPVPTTAPVKKGRLSEGMQKPSETLLSKKGEKLPSDNAQEPGSSKKEQKSETKLEPSSKKFFSSVTELKEGQKELSDLPLPESMKTKAPASKEKETIEAAPISAQPTGSQISQKTEGKTTPVSPLEEKAPLFPSIAEQKSDQEKEGGSEQKKFGEQKIAPLPLPGFDTNIQPLVQAAVTQAAPYLNEKTMALFQQMVGTIYIINSRPGVSTTEVVLNSPAFKDSKFFGSTITIEKYATAPNSLNIRLTGSNEAVSAFNQNLSSLVAAFQNGNFSFRIGRIDTAYQVDKPVFRRKEEEKKDSGDFKGNKEK